MKVINAPDFNQVPFQLRRWVIANKKELPGLKTRRENEIKLFFENKSIPEAGFQTASDEELIDIESGEWGVGSGEWGVIEADTIFRFGD